MFKKKEIANEYDLLQMFVMEMERQGVKRNLIHLDVDDSLAAKISMKLKDEVSPEQAHRLADKCLANEWLEHVYIGAGQYGALTLTASGFGVVRSLQRKQEILANRSRMKKVSDFIEDHKGLFVVITVLITFAGVVTRYFWR
jgi:hypothetical protein